ncbi:CidA/LrgA family protein [Oceanivirga salmonicida]|uniref:CidA/LrgA family protein n=1 Tax=Oceanivirga salmonicida TaxID=1769291 RepID=UPI00082AB1A0|nr:CidA/LrgA family protein [Oceanivirga salmonicida]
MKIFSQLIYFLFFSLLGDSISKGLNLPIPGSVIGMILLFLALQLRFIKLEKIELVGNFFINNLPILFVAAGVGIMTKFELIKPIWLTFFTIAILTTSISIVVIAKIVKFVKDKFEGDINE